MEKALYVEVHTFDQDLHESDYIPFAQVIMMDTKIVDEDHFACLLPDNLGLGEYTALVLEEGELPQTKENDIMTSTYTGSQVVGAI